MTNFESISIQDLDHVVGGSCWDKAKKAIAVGMTGVTIAAGPIGGENKPHVPEPIGTCQPAVASPLTSQRPK